MDIAQLLAFSVQNHASDLHLSAGLPPMLRVNGDIMPIELPALTTDEVLVMITNIMTNAQKTRYQQQLDCDFSFTLEGVARFRVNAFFQNRGAAAVLRTIPSTVATMEQLQLPPVCTELLDKQHGLILVTGPTGSGKSTTLAAMIDHINATRQAHILTIEDPVEFVHAPKESLVSQREVGVHTQSFNHALRAALREDPDVILIGEMRDQETIRLALTAAETGHLVLATLHTASAPKTIDRIVGVFPAEEKEMTRTMLSESLEAVISQTLLKNKEETGRVAAHEIMLATPAMRNLIREGKTAQMYSSMQTAANSGMQTLDAALEKLARQNKISIETLRQHTKSTNIKN
jgi:twitching motility protein PilT